MWISSPFSPSAQPQPAAWPPLRRVRRCLDSAIAAITDAWIATMARYEEGRAEEDALVVDCAVLVVEPLG
jgi:hypothetical protein